MTDASERFSYERWLDRPGWYQVPLEHGQRFRELLRRLDAIYRAHAISWSVRRSRKEPERWFETMPRFREDADARTAAAALDDQPEIFEGLDEFGVDMGNGIWLFEGNEWETVFEIEARVGDWSSFELPPIPPEEMSDAMRLAHRLAPAIASRIDRVLPEGWTAYASNEFVVAGGGWHSVVDFEIEESYEAILDSVQDTISEDRTVPWPAGPGPGLKMHSPQVEVRDGAVHAWFGSRDDPVLELDPIPLSEIEGA